jgi:Asp/Glu/hydantoin racemase
VAAIILNAADSGARAILCTCSSIGPCVDVARPLVDRPLLRVDRPMADAAVRAGPRIAVAATLATTLIPTRDLIAQAAKDVGASVTLDEVLCEGAWSAFEKGDREGYLLEIAADLRAAAHRADVIVLAQASMAGASALLTDLPTPILTSPRSGFEAAVRTWRGAGS